MSDDIHQGIVSNDAANAVHEVEAAFSETDKLVELISDETKGSSINTELRQQIARDRARTQRQRGAAALQKRHSGISTIVKEIVINERVAGAAFERFFPVIENAVWTIEKRGEMFVGAKNHAQIMDQIRERIASMEELNNVELARCETRLSVVSTTENFLQPTYSAPAAVHQVEFRNKLSIRIADLFVAHDKIIASMQILYWNNDIEASVIDEQERKLKKELRDLTSFVSRTLKGMRSKVTVELTEIANASAGESGQDSELKDKEAA